MTKYVLEFRSGSYFVDVDADRGGPLSKAARFDSQESATAWFESHAPWVWFNGGMVVAVEVES